ncbi:MAG: hypothetical protein BWK77_03215 [Verrucomicrobia bacterium A1]|nr:MAG: hypothetical protein BWK77_03215 [Verrucomicrobia bacterium A1]
MTHPRPAETIPPREYRAEDRWILVDRPAWADILRAHLPGMVLTAPILLAARFYPFREQPVITCEFRKWTGIPCAGCGYTRAFQSIAHGNIAGAARDAPVSVLLFAAVVLLLGWNFAGLALRRRLRPGPRAIPGLRARRALIALTILLLAANWFWRLTRGLQ